MVTGNMVAPHDTIRLDLEIVLRVYLEELNF